MKNLVFTFLFVLICSLTKAQTQDSIIQSGFVYFANDEQGKTGIYLSPIINLPASKNTFEEKKKIEDDFREILNKEYNLELTKNSTISFVWNTLQFITTNQYNNMIDLMESNQYTKLTIVSDSSLNRLVNNKTIKKKNNSEYSTNIKVNNNKSAKKWNLYPYADYVGCKTGIYLGTFSSKTACNKRGKSMFGSNGSWCCKEK
ncbi:MAG: hypothetical protein P8P29_06525 [Flavobacteriaceae bacterium]|nr:hypothetical protein [Flavobacteriaceae bacterium]